MCRKSPQLYGIVISQKYEADELFSVAFFKKNSMTKQENIEHPIDKNGGFRGGMLLLVRKRIFIWSASGFRSILLQTFFSMEY